MNSNKTIVTAFYKFNNKAKHNLGKYETWIKNFLMRVSETPMVIYCESDMFPFLKNCRRNFMDKTIFIIRPFKESWTYKMYADVLEKEHLPIDPEKNIHNKELYIVWHQKIELLKEVSETNPFNSKWFIWTDIGCFRNRNRNLDISPRVISDWPSMEKLDKLPKDKITMVQVKQPPKENYELLPNGLSKVSMEFKLCMSASMFVVHKDNINRVFKEFFSMIDTCNDNVPKRFAGKDQDIWAYLFLKNPKMFNNVIPDRSWDPYFYLHSYLL